MSVSARTTEYLKDALADISAAKELVNIMNAASGAGTSSPQAAHSVFAGPSTGSNAAPTFRALVSSDLPTAITFTAPITVGTHHITFGAVAPTTGAWLQGDVCFNTSVAATGNNAGWSCTTAGTPGTWTAWPNLA